MDEIYVVLSCTFIMWYNHEPCISEYWLESPPLGNQSKQSAILRETWKLQEDLLNSGRCRMIKDNFFKNTGS